jgi:hypothetical protein
MKLWLLIEDRLLPAPRDITVLAHFGGEIVPKQIEGGNTTANNCVVEGSEESLMSWLGGKEIWVTDNIFSSWNLVQYGSCEAEQRVKAFSAFLNDTSGLHKVVNQMSGCIYEKYPELANDSCSPDSQFGSIPAAE